MAKVNAKHAKPKEKKSIVGRLIHDVPDSLLNKPKPSDTPTKVLELDVIEAPVIHDDPNPGTTVLGMDFDEPEAEEVVSPAQRPKVEEPEVEEPKSKEPKVEEPKAEDAPKPESKPKTAKKKQAKAPRYAELVLVRKLDGEVVKISKKDFVIGKSKYSDYQVTKNNTVSRSHVVAHKQTDGSLTIEDNDSKNGTFIDGERLEPHEEVKLKDGLSLRMSDEIFEVRKA